MTKAILGLKVRIKSKLLKSGGGGSLNQYSCIPPKKPTFNENGIGVNRQIKGHSSKVIKEIILKTQCSSLGGEHDG